LFTRVEGEEEREEEEVFTPLTTNPQVTTSHQKKSCENVRKPQKYDPFN
jgi:hypothetical protein